MEKEFIPFELSVKLKELGFDEPCLAHLIGFGDGTIENGKYVINYQQVFYPNDFIKSDDKAEELGLHPFGICGVPLYQQAFRWFREKQAIEGFIHKAIEGTYYFVIKRLGNNENNMYEFITNAPKNVDTYEEAELECLKKLIEIVESKSE